MATDIRQKRFYHSLESKTDHCEIEGEIYMVCIEFVPLPVYCLTLRIVERTKFTMTAERRSRDSRRHPTTTAMDCIRGKLLFFLLLFFIITDSKSSSALLLLSVYVLSSGEEKSAFLFKHFGDDIICQADVRG